MAKMACAYKVTFERDGEAMVLTKDDAEERLGDMLDVALNGTVIKNAQGEELIPLIMLYRKA